MYVCRLDIYLVESVRSKLVHEGEILVDQLPERSR